MHVSKPKRVKIDITWAFSNENSIDRRASPCSSRYPFSPFLFANEERTLESLTTVCMNSCLVWERRREKRRLENQSIITEGRRAHLGYRIRQIGSQKVVNLCYRWVNVNITCTIPNSEPV